MNRRFSPFVVNTCTWFFWRLLNGAYFAFMNLIYVVIANIKQISVMFFPHERPHKLGSVIFTTFARVIPRRLT